MQIVMVEDLNVFAVVVDFWWLGLAVLWTEHESCESADLWL